MERFRKAYKPKLYYGDQIPYRPFIRIAGRSYRSEKAMLEAVARGYRSTIKRKRKCYRRRRLLYQVMLKNGRTVEIAYMEVGVKGYYVRYTKVRVLKWRDRKKGGRQPYSGPDRTPGQKRIN